MKVLVFISCITLGLFHSCAFMPSTRLQKEVSTWINKPILFTHDIDNLYAKDTSSVHYSLIYYVDSSICLTCRTSAWDNTISEIEDSVGHSVFSILISSPKSDFLTNTQIHDIKFNRILWIDDQEEFQKINHFSDKDLLHAFLLDSEHRVMVIGNPIASKSIEHLIIKRIREIDSKKQTL